MPSPDPRHAGASTRASIKRRRERKFAPMNFDEAHDGLPGEAQQ
jgi:hypothetical protein